MVRSPCHAILCALMPYSVLIQIRFETAVIVSLPVIGSQHLELSAKLELRHHLELLEHLQDIRLRLRLEEVHPNTPGFVIYKYNIASTASKGTHLHWSALIGMNDVLFLGNTEALLAEQVPTLPTLGTDFTVPLVTTHIIDQTGACS